MTELWHNRRSKMGEVVVTGPAIVRNSACFKPDEVGLDLKSVKQEIPREKELEVSTGGYRR